MSGILNDKEDFRLKPRDSLFCLGTFCIIHFELYSFVTDKIVKSKSFYFVTTKSTYETSNYYHSK